jgi:hypothetical protein
MTGDFFRHRHLISVAVRLSTPRDFRAAHPTRHCCDTRFAGFRHDLGGG